MNPKADEIAVVEAAPVVVEATDNDGNPVLVITEYTPKVTTYSKAQVEADVELYTKKLAESQDLLGKFK